VSFYVRERYYGTFRRSMTLLAGIDESSAPTSRTVCWRSPFRGRRRGGSVALAHRDQGQIRGRRLTWIYSRVNAGDTESLDLCPILLYSTAPGFLDRVDLTLRTRGRPLWDRYSS
jgi:hypothetical protein